MRRRQKRILRTFPSIRPSLVSFLPSHLSLGGLLERPLFLDDLEDLLLSRERERLLRRRGGDLDLIRRGGEAGYERERVRCVLDRWIGWVIREVMSEFG